MASIIDNREKKMIDSLRNALNQAESVDILTAFFYFSGFNARPSASCTDINFFLAGVDKFAVTLSPA